MVRGELRNMDELHLGDGRVTDEDRAAVKREIDRLEASLENVMAGDAYAPDALDPVGARKVLAGLDDAHGEEINTILTASANLAEARAAYKVAIEQKAPKVVENALYDAAQATQDAFNALPWDGDDGWRERKLPDVVRLYLRMARLAAD